MAINMNKDTMRFIASAFMLVIIVALMMYLTFIEVPEGNKDIIVTILGVLLGAGAAAVPNLFGDSDKEKESLLYEVNSLRNRIKVIEAERETLRQELTEIRSMLIERHVVNGEGIKNEKT